MTEKQAERLIEMLAEIASRLEDIEMSLRRSA